MSSMSESSHLGHGQWQIIELVYYADRRIVLIKALDVLCSGD